MKGKLLLIILFITTLSCNYNYYQKQTSQYKLSTIPMFSHQNKIDVIFTGEEIKEINYIKTGVIEVNGFANESYNSLLFKLQKNAQLEGVDAVLIIDRNNINTLKRDGFAEAITYLATNKNTIQYNSVNTTVLSAVGIKYIKNINYLDQFVKEISTAVFDTSNKIFKNTSTSYLNFNKGVDSTKGDLFYYNKFIFPYSEEHLVNEKNENWTYRQPDSFKLFRNLYFNRFFRKSCKISYNSSSQISSIEIFYDGGRKDTILYKYTNSLLMARIVKHSNNLTFIEKYEYINNKIKCITICKINGNAEIPFLKQDFMYYNNEDAYLFK